MRAKIQRWGNSLALRIPKAFAVEACLEDETPVELTLREGLVVVAPVRARKFNLDELLAGVTKKNMHGEWATGPARGKET